MRMGIIASMRTNFVWQLCCQITFSDLAESYRTHNIQLKVSVVAGPIVSLISNAL